MRFKLGQKIIDLIRHKKETKTIRTCVFGLNNDINIKNTKKKNKLMLSIYGNNKVTIDTEEYFNANIVIGTNDSPVNNCSVFVSKNTTSNGIYVILMEDNSSLYIGEDTMFSDDIKIMCSDTYTIINSDNSINIGKKVTIGNHVWVGTNVRIGKNVEIPDNCIIGMGSVVCKKFYEKNCIIAGNPARVVKKEINWDRLRPKQYIDSIKRERERE